MSLSIRISSFLFLCLAATTAIAGKTADSHHDAMSAQAGQLNAPAGMILIAAGTNSGIDPEAGAYSLTVEDFYIDQYLITKEQWTDVSNWANENGYDIGSRGISRGVGYPVCAVNWFDCIKWCNARSEKEGRPAVYRVKSSIYRTGFAANVAQTRQAGYRLPTEMEWEYAARGGRKNLRFPWGNTISHADANYYSSSHYDYDVSPTRGYHPLYAIEDGSCTSPVGAFPPNGYGLYDVIGNLWEWCFDCWHVDSGSRAFRGGAWMSFSFACKIGYPTDHRLDHSRDIGLRCVLSPGW